MTRTQLLELVARLPIDERHACWGNAAEAIRAAWIDLAADAAADRAADEWSAMARELKPAPRPKPDPQAALFVGEES